MTLKLYFTPGRSWLPRWLLGEMGEPFELITLDIQKGEQNQPAYLAINPLGKLPALDAGGEIITETAAVCIYLADLRPARGLAVPQGAPGRGRYLTLPRQRIAPEAEPQRADGEHQEERAQPELKPAAQARP